MRYYFFLILIGFTSIISAQTYDQLALTFARDHYLGGTARFIGVAGNFTAVGPDAGNIGLNPASSGMMRSSFINFSLGSDYNSQDISYLDNTTSDARFGMHLSSLTAAFKLKKVKKDITFAIGYNRHSTLQFNRSYAGVNANNSIVDLYAEEANRFLDLGPDGIGSVDGNGFPTEVTPETFSSWAGWLTNWDTLTGTYVSPIGDAVSQNYSQELRGSKSEIAFSLGGATDNKKLFLGATIGIPIIRYQSDIRYTETDDAEVNPLFSSLSENRFYQVNGAGINLKLGVIGRPTNWLRIGAAIHSPSAMKLDENWTHRLTTSVSDSLTTQNNCQPCDEYSGSFEYRLRMPWRANAGLAFFFKKYGFLSLQYDVVDYNTLKYDMGRDNQVTEGEVNSIISAKYGLSHRLGAGIEGAFDKFRVRIGYAYQTSPFREDIAVDDYDQTSQTFSGGLGIVLDKWAFDLGYSRTQLNQYSEFYQLTNEVSPGALEKTVLNNAVLSIAYKLK